MFQVNDDELSKCLHKTSVYICRTIALARLLVARLFHRRACTAANMCSFSLCAHGGWFVQHQIDHVVCFQPIGMLLAVGFDFFWIVERRRKHAAQEKIVCLPRPANNDTDMGEDRPCRYRTIRRRYAACDICHGTQHCRCQHMVGFPWKLGHTDSAHQHNASATMQSGQTWKITAISRVIWQDRIKNVLFVSCLISPELRPDRGFRFFMNRWCLGDCTMTDIWLQGRTTLQNGNHWVKIFFTYEFLISPWLMNVTYCYWS